VIGKSSPITLTLETCGFVARIGLGRPNRKAKQRLITKASGLSLEQAIDGTSIVSQTLRRAQRLLQLFLIVHRPNNQSRYIKSTLPVSEAMEILDRLAWDWWLDEMPRARNRMMISLGYA
jgi:hypothetical protein